MSDKPSELLDDKQTAGFVLLVLLFYVVLPLGANDLVAFVFHGTRLLVRSNQWIVSLTLYYFLLSVVLNALSARTNHRLSTHLWFVEAIVVVFYWLPAYGMLTLYAPASFGVVQWCGAVSMAGVMLAVGAALVGLTKTGGYSYGDD